MDPIQKVLIIVVTVLTVLLLIVGVQVILVIMDLRRSVKRMNSILEDAILGGGLIKPEKITSIVGMFKRQKEVEKMGMGEPFQGETVAIKDEISDQV